MESLLDKHDVFVAKEEPMLEFNRNRLIFYQYFHQNSGSNLCLLVNKSHPSIHRIPKSIPYYAFQPLSIPQFLMPQDRNYNYNFKILSASDLNDAAKKIVGAIK